VAAFLEMIEEQDKVIIATRGFFSLEDELEPWALPEWSQWNNDKPETISFWRRIFQLANPPIP
jgi:hypothetical protein